MPEITTQAAMMFEDGNCSKTALYSVKNANAGDTVDVSPKFSIVKRAGIVSSTGTTIAGVTITGQTMLTIPNGPVADGVWLIVVGVAR